MKLIATIEVDFELGPLGTRSRLADDMLGIPVLRRTLERVLRAEWISGVHLVVSAEQAGNARELAAGLDVKIETHNGGPVPWREPMSAARKWSLDGWRGGLGGATVFDESLHPWVLDALAKREQADAVVSISPAAVLIDPHLLDRLAAHFEEIKEQFLLAFTQTAPGLSAVILAPKLLADMAQAAQPLGRIMAYQPNDPKRDMVMQSCFFPVDTAIAHAVGRCVADTDAGFQRARTILNDLGEMDLDAARVSKWLTEHQHDVSSTLPDEVEIELTTETPLAGSTLRPGGENAGTRGPIALDVFERLIREVAARDDLRVVLGGYGDPLRHIEFERCLRICRDAGVFALAVRTPCVDLDSARLDAVLEHRVDVFNVLLDAHSPETYRKLHNADHFEQAVANVERLQSHQRDSKRPLPLIVPEMLKTRANMDEMEAFYDDWLRRAGSAVITGPSDYAGQWPIHAVMSMAPPGRTPCRRIFHRAMVLADGRVTVCDQDFRGRHALGTIADQGLAKLWTGERMRQVRRSHLDHAPEAMPLCPHCDEWHRP